MMRRGIGWPIGVTVVLAAVVVTNIWVAVVAGRDPSFAIEPDYYRKATAWDATMAQARANAALRWKLSPRLDAFTRSGTMLHVALTDSTGAPIRDARINVSALFNARASTVYAATLTARDAGDYVVTLPVDRAGDWELRFDVVRGADRFTLTTRVDAVPSGTP